jgi:type I restriction enzyme S subunit
MKSEDWVTLNPDERYREVTVRLWGKGVALRREVTGAEIAAERRLRVRAGQFIVSRIDARNGAFGLLPDSLDGAVVSHDFPVFVPNSSRIVPSFLNWMSKTRDFVDICKAASEGTTNRVRLQENRFLEMKISLPSLPEQRWIVARIDELTAKLRDAHRLRQGALNEREALLKTARREIISKCPGTDVALKSVCVEIIDNLHSNPHYADAGVPCVRSPDVGYGTLNLDTALRTDEDEYRRRTMRGEPRNNDIVLVREGGGTGKCALVLPGQRFSLGQRVMMLRPDTQRILPKFFLHQLLSPLIQEDQIAPLSKGSASPHLNIGTLKQFSFRLPSITNQQRIVAKLDALQAQANAVRNLQRQTATELDAILPSILSKAFKGGL